MEEVRKQAVERRAERKTALSAWLDSKIPREDAVVATASADKLVPGDDVKVDADIDREVKTEAATDPQQLESSA